MKLILITLSTFLSLNAFSVCLEASNAELLECTSMNSTRATKWCHDKYGEDFDAYYTTDTCSKEEAYRDRGEEYKVSKNDTEGQVEAACMSYEKGMNLGCEYYDYQLAQNFCSENFGMKYIAFIPSRTCSLEKAAKLRGEVSSKKLLNNLNSSVDELTSLITMIDQEGTGQAMGHLGTKGILIGNEFYTKTMKKILSYMKMTKNTLYKNSQLNVPVKSDKYIVSFLRQALSYSALLSRVYKIYAHVAHKNSYVLKSYGFDNLKGLNLVLKKEFALELLAKINFKVKHVNNSKDIEFIVSEQEKQNFEYLAISKPNSKMEYAKLLTYMGTREVVTNHWAVQRLTSQSIANDNIRSCGKGYLSFRPKQNSMTKSSAYTDLWEYDVFFNEYAPKWEGIIQKSWDISLLDGSSASKMISSVLNSNTSVKNEISKNLEGQSLKSEIKNRVNLNGSIYRDSENNAWVNFSNFHFSTIVFPGDDILNKNSIISRITEVAFEKRAKAISETFIAMYPYMSDRELSGLEKTVSSYLNKSLKSSFRNRLKNAIAPSFIDYNSTSTRSANREKKVEETLKAVKNAAVALAVQKEFEKEKPNLEGMKFLQPHNMSELMLVFETGMSSRLRATLKQDKKKAKIVEGFFRTLNDLFVKQFTKVDEKGNRVLAKTRAEREKGLRRIGYAAALKLGQMYPYHAKNSSLLKERYIGRETAIDNTYTKTPVYKNGRVIPMKKRDLAREFRLKKKSSRESYVIKKDNVGAELPRVLSGKYVKKSNNKRKKEKARAGYNADKISTGEVVINDTITEREIKELKEDSFNIQKNATQRLLKSSAAFGSKKNQKRLDKEISQKIAAFNKSLVIETNEELVHELFVALNMESFATKGVRVTSGYAGKKFTQAAFASHYTSSAYQIAPILKADARWKEVNAKRPYIQRGSRKIKNINTKTGPLAYKIIHSAYSKETGSINDTRALKFINETFDKTIKNASNKMTDFCNADYINYKNDDNFKKVFNASSFLRSNLKNPAGVSKDNYEKIQKFDEAIRKEVRGKMEALNEDWLEPILMYSGTIAIVAMLIVFAVGTGGTGLPAAILGIASLIGTIDMVISVPIIMGSFYARVQTQFIEVPAQLKFSQSLAHSQLGESSIINWDAHRHAKKEAQSKQLAEVGYMALDLFFVGSLGMHVKRTAGFVARSAYKKATGIKLRGWSAPTPNMYRNVKFAEYRKKHNVFKSLIKRAGNKIDKVRMYQPKFQAVPVATLRTTALRQGFNKAAKELKVSNKPWTLIGEMQSYLNQLKARTTTFKAYSKAEGKIIEQIHGNITDRELMKFGREYSTFSFVLKSFKKAILEKRLRSYFTKFGDELNDLRKMRGELLDGRIKSIQLAIDKLQDVKNANMAGNKVLIGKGDEFGDFLSKLSDEEILALEEVVKKASKKGTLRQFKPVFKLYEKVTTGFANPSHMEGIKNASLQAGKIIYPHNTVMGDDIVGKYKFENDSEDIVNFYESMIKQSNAKGEKLDDLKNSIESGLSKFIFYDKHGNRIFRK